MGTQGNSVTVVQLSEIYEVPSESDTAEARGLLQIAFESFHGSLEKGNALEMTLMVGDVLDIGGHPAADIAGQPGPTGAAGQYSKRA